MHLSTNDGTIEAQRPGQRPLLVAVVIPQQAAVALMRIGHSAAFAALVAHGEIVKAEAARAVARRYRIIV